MARRIVRTLLQFTVLSVVLAVLIFVLDFRYRVLPPSIHSLLPEHHAGTVVTDVRYVACSSVNPLQPCTLSKDEGWTRINKDVYLKGGWISQGYVHVQRKKESELLPTDRIVVDVKVGRIKPVAEDGAGDKNGGWQSRTGGIWIKRQEKKTDAAITGVDVLFGPDAAEVREGWELMPGSMSVGETPRLSVRRGAPVEAKKPTVRMRKDHKLKIIQVSDLHLSTGVGKCRHAEPPESAAGCEADPRTLDFIARILDDEKPDIAVLSGDQINGETAPDAQTAIFKFAEPFIKRKIPYATILGNHDDEGNLLRRQIMELTASLPYSLSEVGPILGGIQKDRKGREQNEGGAGNYIVEVLAHGHNDHRAVTLYFLDSHSYSTDPKVDGYDFIKSYQIDWFRKQHKSLQAEHAKYSFMHLDLAFIHIPLPEYRQPDKPIVGSWKEPPTAPVYNSNFKDELVNAGVAVLSAGHDHANDYCLLDGLWMCYAGGSGFGGYGGYGGYHRRVRIFEVDQQTARITTWKRREYDDQGPIDVQTIVEGGKVVGPAS